VQAVEDLLFRDTDHVTPPIVMAIKLASARAGDTSTHGKVRSVGVAFADTTSRELGVSDFIDNELFSNLEVSSFFNSRTILRLTNGI